MSTYWASSGLVKTRGPVSRRKRVASATARSGTASSEMRAGNVRVAVGEFCCLFAAAGVAAALRAALEGLDGIGLWEGLYVCSF